MPATTKKPAGPLEIPEPRKGHINVAVMGTSPYICEAMSSKAKQQLLLPAQSTRASRRGSLKHDPLAEYRDSCLLLDEPAPTAIGVMASAFKQAMVTAAKDVPGTTGAQIGRWIWVEGFKIPIYGRPELMMSVVRSADINRTPDIRTRAVLREWATVVTVEFIEPYVNEQVVINLLTMAGLVAGVGGWRPEKGSANFGQFQPCAPALIAGLMQEGREKQLEALLHPQFYDQESKDLFAWAVDEARHRGFSILDEEATAS